MLRFETSVTGIWSNSYVYKYLTTCWSESLALVDLELLTPEA